jgi:predicted Zn-dependent peptidase
MRMNPVEEKGVRLAGRRPRLTRGLAFLLLGFGLLGLPPGGSPGSVPSAAAQGSLSGLLVTAAATGEDLGAPSTGPIDLSRSTSGLILQMTLENRTGQDLSGLQIRAPAPTGTRVTESWLSQRGQTPGQVQGAAVSWSGLGLRNGQRLGPFTYRLAPDRGASAGTVFREATIRPEVTWTGPTAGRAPAPGQAELRLNGLWGEEGLRRTLLPSGLTVLTRERPDSATVSVRIAARAGSRDEDAITRGGSHWLEHAHFLGTTHRQDLDVEINTVGGASNASTGWEATDYWYLVPAEHFDLAIDLLSDQMLNSTFRRESFDQERRVVFEELKMRDDTPSIRAFDEFINLVFRVSPLRQHPSGTIDSVESIPIETILSYRDQHYTAPNMAIAVVGRIRHDEAVAKIERAFVDLPRGPRFARPRVAEPPQTEPRVRVVDVGEGNQLAEVRIGWPTPGDDSADSPPLVIIEEILGTTGRRLVEEIQERRALTTSVDASYLAFSDAGAFMIDASTQPRLTDQVIEAILAQVERLRNGDVTEDDVRASLRAFTGRRAISDESNQQQTGRAQIEVSGVLDSWAEYLARLQAVTPAEVQRVARRYLDPTNYTLVLVRG